MCAAVGRFGRQEQSQSGNSQARRSGRIQRSAASDSELVTTLLQVRPWRLNTGRAEVTPVYARMWRYKRTNYLKPGVAIVVVRSLLGCLVS